MWQLIFPVLTQGFIKTDTFLTQPQLENITEFDLFDRSQLPGFLSIS